MLSHLPFKRKAACSPEKQLSLSSGLWLRCCHFCPADVSTLLQQQPLLAVSAWAVNVPRCLSLRYAVVHDILQLSPFLKLALAVACPLAGGQVISWHSDRDQRGYLGQPGTTCLLTQNHGGRCVGAFTGVVTAYGFFSRQFHRDYLLFCTIFLLVLYF